MEECLLNIFYKFSRGMSYAAIAIFLIALPVFIRMNLDEKHCYYKKARLEQDLFGDDQGYVTLLSFFLFFCHSLYCIWLISKIGLLHDFTPYILISLSGQCLIYVAFALVILRRKKTQIRDFLTSPKDNKFYLFFVFMASIFMFEWLTSMGYANRC